MLHLVKLDVKKKIYIVLLYASNKCYALFRLEIYKKYIYLFIDQHPLETFGVIDVVKWHSGWTWAVESRSLLIIRIYFTFF